MRATRRPLLVLTLAALATGTLLVGAAPAAGAPRAPVVISFEKQFNEDATDDNGGIPTWTGTVPGGTLEVRLLDGWASGPVEHLVLDFIVAGPFTFTARVRGTFNPATERTALNGTVTSGMFEGARVHEEGLRVDAATSRFVGTIRIMRGSAA
jgi:hypothetical protein